MEPCTWEGVLLLHCLYRRSQVCMVQCVDLPVYSSSDSVALPPTSLTIERQRSETVRRRSPFDADGVDVPRITRPVSGAGSLPPGPGVSDRSGMDRVGFAQRETETPAVVRPHGDARRASRHNHAVFPHAAAGAAVATKPRVAIG